MAQTFESAPSDGVVSETRSAIPDVWVASSNRSGHSLKPFVSQHCVGKGTARLDDQHLLYTGYGPQYALIEMQQALDELGLADDVYVKYADDEE